MKIADVVSFRTDRRLLAELAGGTKRGQQARLLRQLIAEEARRRGITLEAQPERRNPQKAA